jgi:DNA recombination protein RmuC
MENSQLILILCVGVANLILVYQLRSKASGTESLERQLAKIESGLNVEFRLNREEGQKSSRESREELNASVKDLKKELTETLKTIVEQNVSNLKDVNKTLDEKLQLLSKSSKESLKSIEENFDRNIESFNKTQREKFELLDKKQAELIVSTEKKLDLMRETVEEKLQKTLNERLGQSFETVGKQLQAVQEGLGEMRTLATDVGGLKKVLGNVKMRGGIGEMQLSMLLDQILAPDQYAANVKTKHGSSDLVEFAIRLPGKEEGLDQVWLPIDAKFPKDYYEQLLLAHDVGDPTQIDIAHKALEAAVKKMAKDISEKYIDPPYTTDFAIMFLPFEGIYAEVVRKSALLDDLQRNYKIIVTGPTTLAAILNSLQMGFKTLAIQKSSSEVWKVLGGVKAEFEKFGGLIEKVQKNLQTGMDDLDLLVGTRTNVIRRKLKSIEALSETDTKLILPEIQGIELEEE